jgi:hypothetical protein
VRSASAKTGERWLSEATNRKDLPMSFIRELASDTHVFTLRRNKAGPRRALSMALRIPL